jgi:type IV secretory pathway ATPase VirB11/archaellum biosynthesis ATPase
MQKVVLLTSKTGAGKSSKMISESTFIVSFYKVCTINLRDFLKQTLIKIKKARHY